MANLIDYVKWRGDLSFKADPFNHVDGVILAETSYVEFKENVSAFPSTEIITFKEAADKVFEGQDYEKMTLGIMVPKTILEMALLMKEAVRYKDIGVSNFVNEISKKTKSQFSAVTFHLSENVIYISFRGTDDSLMGWQENLDMINDFPVPAQAKAAQYVNKIGKLFPNAKIYIGGHSKGGNLATYAAIYCHNYINERIIRCYCNDGQGMPKDKVDTERYEMVKDKILKIIPEQDVVGMIFDSFAGNTMVVKSSAKGVLQHDGFSWELMGNNFITIDDVADNAKKLSKAISELIASVSDEDRKGLANEMYEFMLKINEDTLLECQRDTLSLLKYITKVSPRNKKVFTQLIFDFVKYKQIG